MNTDMKNKIISFITILAIAASLSSCKDFLNLQPGDGIPVSESINNVSDAQNALNGVYRMMASSAYYGRDMLLYGDLKGGDLCILTLSVAGDGLYYFSHTPSSTNYQSFWNQCYAIILQTNNILGTIESGKVQVTSTKEQTTLNDLKGQALAVRALCHFDLARLYGYPYLKNNGASLGAPVVTKTLEAYDKLTRNTVAECYARALSDLNAAIPLMGVAKTTGILNKYGAQALLAQVSMFKGDYETAYTQCKAIIDSKVYTAYTAANWVNSWKAQGGTESIFELLIVPDESDLKDSAPTSYYGIRDSKVNGTNRKDLGSVLVSDIFLDMFKNYPNDVRWGIFREDELAQQGTVPGRKGSLAKYEGDGKARVSATNIKITRLTEVLLYGAEAAIEKATPDVTNALAWLNLVRKRDASLAEFTSTDKAAILAEIHRQRRIDLMGEGKLYFDILRKGGTVTFKDGGVFPDIPAGTRESTVNWNFYRSVLPIGQNELNANPALRDQQNPGY